MNQRKSPFSLLGISMVLLSPMFSEAIAQLQRPETDTAQTDTAQTDWAQWRGPLGTGVSVQATPPVSWSEEENVQWKTELPGRGHSSPIVWQDQVFLTTAVPVGSEFDPIADERPGSHDNLKVRQRHRYVVLSVDRKQGNILWERTVNENVPHEGGHYTGSLASASPLTDGQRLYAYFGSNGLFALDLDGQILWEKQFGKMHSKHGHGEGASPCLYKDQLFINWDEEGQSFLAAIDVKTGKENWRAERDEVTSWASPIVGVVDGQPQVIVAGTHRIRGYSTTDGSVIWECGGLSANVVATPVFQDNLLIAASSYDTRALLAIDLHQAQGDLTGTGHVLWKTNQKTPYIPSPLLYRDQLYYLRHYQGIVSRVEARTGEETATPIRIGGLNEIYASPVAADDRIYLTGRKGVTVVLSHSQYPRTLGINQLDDVFNASPALAGSQMFLRGETYLYALQEQP